jgi:pimeloyl-ACP methyl ester carboxylesterase
MPDVERAGQRVAYVDAAGDGATVVLAHNLMSHAGTFAAVTARLAPRWRVLAVDLRGHGASGGATGPFTTVDLAEDLAAVMDAAGVDAAFVAGTSLGAAAAAELALRWPARVRGLALMAATPFTATLADRAKFAALRGVLRALGPGPVMPAMLHQLLGASYRANDRAGVAAAADRIRATRREDLAWAVRSWAQRPRLAGRLAAITAPTVVVAGDEDTACPRRFSEAIAAEIGGARLELVRGSGHSLQLERPAEVAAILTRWIAG